MRHNGHGDTLRAQRRKRLEEVSLQILTAFYSGTTVPNTPEMGAKGAIEIAKKFIEVIDKEEV